MIHQPPSQVVGFTGTQEGMTDAQLLAVGEFMLTLPIPLGQKAGAHGDCIGADEQFHRILLALDWTQYVHPPSDPKKRAFCEVKYGAVFAPLPYLVRNQAIVDQSFMGIAAPKDYEFPGARNLRGQGTWSTAYKFYKADKMCKVFFPDGTSSHFVELL